METSLFSLCLVWMTWLLPMIDLWLTGRVSSSVEPLEDAVAVFNVRKASRQSSLMFFRPRFCASCSLSPMLLIECRWDLSNSCWNKKETRSIKYLEESLGLREKNIDKSAYCLGSDKMIILLGRFQIINSKLFSFLSLSLSRVTETKSSVSISLTLQLIAWGESAESKKINLG